MNEFHRQENNTTGKQIKTWQMQLEKKKEEMWQMQLEKKRKYDKYVSAFILLTHVHTTTGENLSKNE